MKVKGKAFQRNSKVNRHSLLSWTATTEIQFLRGELNFHLVIIFHMKKSMEKNAKNVTDSI